MTIFPSPQLVSISYTWDMLIKKFKYSENVWAPSFKDKDLPLKRFRLFNFVLTTFYHLYNSFSFKFTVSL